MLDEPEEPLIPGDVVIPYEKNPNALWSWDRTGYFRNALMKFGRMMDADFYAHPPAPDAAPDYHYLNAASLPHPVADVRAEARRVFELWSKGELTDQRKAEILADARREAAALVNLPDERSVVLCRNASEALSYFLWLSGVLESTTQTWPIVVSTDVENPSIQRQIFIAMDHSNVTRKDTITTYPEFASQRPPNYIPPAPRATGLRWGQFGVARQYPEQSLKHLEHMIQMEGPDVLIMSHVLRTDGRELPVKEWTAKAREWKAKYHPHAPDLFVVIDGAQALGNIEVDVPDLDCEMYVGCGQKALQGETAGLLYLNPDNPRIRAGLERVRGLTPDTQVVLRGMFHPDLGVPNNVDDDVSYADLAGFTANVRRLKAAGMIGDAGKLTGLNGVRSALKARCLEGLQGIAARTGKDIRLLGAADGTPFILAFRIGGDPFIEQGDYEYPMRNPEGIFEPGAMHNRPLPTESRGKDMAKALHERNVGIAFLRRGNTFRVSFSDRSTPEDVDAFLREFETLCGGN